MGKSTARKICSRLRKFRKRCHSRRRIGCSTSTTSAAKPNSSKTASTTPTRGASWPRFAIAGTVLFSFRIHIIRVSHLRRKRIAHAPQPWLLARAPLKTKSTRGIRWRRWVNSLRKQAQIQDTTTCLMTPNGPWAKEVQLNSCKCTRLVIIISGLRVLPNRYRIQKASHLSKIWCGARAWDRSSQKAMTNLT